MTWRKAASAAGALVLVAAGVLAVGAPASAATPSGCGYSCDDEDPSSYWASLPPEGARALCPYDAVTVKTASGGGYAVELRYSHSCRTAWARSASEGYFWVERKSPHRVEDAYPDPTSDVAPWTRMVNDAGLLSRACFHYPYGDDICSGWY